MNKKNIFFKWVWHINGLAIMLVCILLTAFLLENISFASRTSSHYKEAVVTSLADDPEEKEKWVLGYSENIRGTNILFVPLVSQNNEIIPFSHNTGEVLGVFAMKDYKASPAKNILFINKETNKSTWLFNKNNQLIISANELTNYQKNQRDRVTKAMIYKVINIDTNNDGVIDTKDSQQIALSKPDGSGFTTILKEYDRIIEESTLENGDLFLLYQNKGIAYTERFSTNGFKSTGKLALPKVNSK